MGIVPQFTGYSFDGWETIRNLQQYSAEYRDVINAFSEAILAALRVRGFDIQILKTPLQVCDPAAGCYDVAGYQVILSRNGASEEHTVGGRGDAQRFGSADEAAAYHEKVFMANTGTSVSVSEPITPAAAPTVQTQSTIQPVQAPSAPQAGTVSAGGSSAAQDPPATTSGETLRSFDEWNWHYRQRTGQVPPAPETVGFPVSRRGEQISYQEWQQYTSAWFASQGLPPASAALDDPGAAGTQPEGASGGWPGVQNQANLYTLVAALLALLGTSR